MEMRLFYAGADKIRGEILDKLCERHNEGKPSDKEWREDTDRMFMAEPGSHLEETPQWPEPMTDAAYYGLAGDVVRAIGPDTESDPAALLVQFLLAFGNEIGRHSYWEVESTSHYLNLFAALVGATSKARKGTSLDRVMGLFNDIDADWLRCRANGLSTGEGLIHAVRDPILKRNKKTGEMEVVEEGVEDKRLLITEPEFARVLKVGDREAATLPSILRDAWDGRDLRNMNKNSPERSTGAHISLIAHITEGELQRTLSETNRTNGFANRFLWVCVRRSKSLPHGGKPLSEETRNDLVERIRKAVRYGKTPRTMGLGARAKPLWEKVYPTLSEGVPGLLGATTDRAEAIVRRLACLYALLDKKNEVWEQHLRAALEVWRYCFDSARFLFGASSADPVAEAILKGLRSKGQSGMSRTDISSDIFRLNKSSKAIGDALMGLRKRGLIRSSSVPQSGAGRPKEQWYVV